MPRRKIQPTPTVQPTAIKRAAIYLRVSTEEQANDGYGLDVQRERCKAQITVKAWEFAGQYVDAGISGTKDESERPELARLLNDATAGKLDAVIVLALDRLGRKTQIVLNLVDKLSQAGVALVSCKESLDTSTPQGQFVLTMFAALAQLERDTIVERTTAGRNERGKRDGEKGGRVPFGYRRIKETGIEIDSQAAEVVRRIFALRAQGLTLNEIAFDVSGWADSPRGGRRWYASSVSEILKNEAAYQGGLRGDSSMCWPVILG